jgi:hypothetical protein
MYECDEKRSFDDRNKAWAAAMEEVHRANADDREAETFYLMALRPTAPNGDRTYAIQRKVGPQLEKLMVSIVVFMKVRGPEFVNGIPGVPGPKPELA